MAAFFSSQIFLQYVLPGLAVIVGHWLHAKGVNIPILGAPVAPAGGSPILPALPAPSAPALPADHPLLAAVQEAMKQFEANLFAQVKLALQNATVQPVVPQKAA